MVKSELIKLPVSPHVSGVPEAQARTALIKDGAELLHDLLRCVFQHGRHDVLLEWRQVLRNLAIHLIVLLPQLYVKEGIR